MGSFAAFSTPAITAYCLVVRATGAWALTTGDTWSGGAGQAATLANGTLPAPFDPTRTHSLQLRMAGSAISVTVDGAALATVSDSTYQAGMAAVGSGYHAAAWGGLALEAATD